MLRWLGIYGVILVFLQLATFTAAWPWPPKLEHIEGLILRRADSKSESSAAATTGKVKASTPAKASASKTPAPASQTGKAKGSTAPAPASGSAAATSGGKASSGAKKTKASAAKTTKAAKSSAVDARLAAGGVSILTPAVTAASTYYKAGSNITFGWNYTSLVNDPKAVNVFITCALNSATYTVSNNMSFYTSAKVVWDTQPEIKGDNPLLTGEYTLVIHDAAKDVTQVASAGDLAPYSAHQFPIYTPQPYQNRTEWKCAVCSGAMSDMERQTLKFTFGMCAVTILSFTWFVSGTGLFQ